MYLNMNLLKYYPRYIKNKVELQNPGGGLHFYIKIKENANINSMELFNECMKIKF